MVGYLLSLLLINLLLKFLNEYLFKSTIFKRIAENHLMVKPGLYKSGFFTLATLGLFLTYVKSR